MRLNLGCADMYIEGWHNVDFMSPHKVDESVDLRKALPWKKGSITHVYAGHLFEHLKRSECVQLSKRLLKCMNPKGGVLVVVGPDIPQAEAMIEAGTFDHTYHSLDSLIHGASRWPGDEHQWETSANDIYKVLKEAGWPTIHKLSIDQLEGGWPVIDSSQAWQYCIRGYTGSYSSSSESKEG